MLLIVEDNENTRYALDMMLGDDFQLVMAASYDEALEEAATETFDALLLDIHLGGACTGGDLLHVRQEKPTCADAMAITCTAFATRSEKADILEAGFDEYVRKPANTEHLISLLTSAAEKAT